MKKAFTLIELMVVIVLIGIMATIVFPRFFTRNAKFDWKNVLSDVNNLVSFTRQEAIASQNIHRIVFQTNVGGRDVIFVQVGQDDPEDPTKIIYKPVKSYYFDTEYILDRSVKLVSFYIGKEEQFEDNKGRANCYILPDGLVQDVTIYLSCKKEKVLPQVTFRMQPFFGKFKMLQGHVKPDQEEREYAE